MVPLGACDVAVCDGFTGNVQLKTIGGRGEVSCRKRSRACLWRLSAPSSAICCAKRVWTDFREVFNQDKIGGAPFLGIAKPVIKAHGSSNELR